MIKNLQRKFIAIAMVSIVIVLASILTAINIINYSSVKRSVDMKIDLLIQEGGNFPNEPPERIPGKFENLSPETPFDTRYFSVLFDGDGNTVKIDTGKVVSLTSSEAESLARAELKNKNMSGFSGIYRFSALTLDDGTALYIFVNAERELNSFYSFLLASICVSAVGLVAVFLLVLFLSRYAIRPVLESQEKQKRFITDAGHEIKTPITIIDANAEVIEMENGASEWTEGIKKQTKRLTQLTEKLIMLSRMQESSYTHTVLKFSLSEAVCDVASHYNALISSSGKSLLLNVDEDIELVGDERSIRQLISLLLDNAVKYSDDGALIELSLRLCGKTRCITVKNTVESVTRGRLDRFFERFYREDSSRNSKTGGSGIGLSVAEAIVTAHKGKITAHSPDGKSVVFNIQL